MTDEKPLIPYLVKARNQLLARQAQLKCNSTAANSRLLLGTVFRFYCRQHHLDALALCHWLELDLRRLLQLETQAIGQLGAKRSSAELLRLATNFGIDYQKLEAIVQEFVN
jgi:hypothetical protein